MIIVKQIIWNVVEHVTVRTLLERFKASKNNIHCMDEMKFSPDTTGELMEFKHNWDWIAKQPLHKKLYVVDGVSETSYIT